MVWRLLLVVVDIEPFATSEQREAFDPMMINDAKDCDAILSIVNFKRDKVSVSSSIWDNNTLRL